MHPMDMRVKYPAGKFAESMHGKITVAKNILFGRLDIPLSKC